jgi:Secretion system C-terminal sorting domain
MFKRLLAGIFFLLSLCSLYAQGWENVYGGSGIDYGTAVLTTQDGGLIVCGHSTSFANPQDPLNEVYVIKTDVDGDTLWTNSYGDEELRVYGHSIIETSGGSFVIAGNNKDTTNLEEEDVYLLKIDNQGNKLWDKTYGGLSNDLGYSVIETSDGGYAIIGETESFGSGSRDIYLIKTNENGDTLWTNTYGGEDRDNGYSIVETTDNGFAIAGYIASEGNTIKEAFLIKTDLNGVEEWSTSFGQSVPVAGASIILANESGFLVTAYLDYSTFLIKVDENGVQDWAKEMPDLDIIFGNSLTYTTDGGIAIAGSFGEDAKLIKTDENGNIVWSKTYGGVLYDDRAYSISPLDNGGLALTGYNQSFGSFDNHLPDAYIIYTDSLGNVYSNFVEGNVFYDLDGNCVQDGGDYGLNDWLIEVAGEQTFYGLSDIDGNYSIPIEAGDYTLNMILINEYWENCVIDFPLSFGGTYDTTIVDFPVKSIIDCPLLEVDISTPFLRRCFDNVYTVNYCNDGTLLAENAKVEVTLDEYLIVNNTSPPYDLLVGNTYTFNVGDIDVGECGQLLIYTTVDCDSTILGQTHCVEAHIFPDSICFTPDPQWSGASIELDAVCEGDSVAFTIKNIGTNITDPTLTYIIIEDDVMLYEDEPFNLSPENSIIIKVPVDGATLLRMEADQEPGHPGYNFPSVSVEGCGLIDNSEWSLGYFTMYSENDGNPFVSIDCQENVGSWDPNDKRGFPKGYREEHLITDSTDLEYHIRFQNTGSDTAFRVVIRDTISEFLDIRTLKAGSSSHLYDMEIYGNGIVKFTFENINLPDSTTNELESHGFVKFRISQKPNNQVGTEIYNSAAIYFDFNAPVITNETMHKIGEDFIEIIVGAIEVFKPEVKVNVFPNPFVDATTFEIVDNKNLLLKRSIFSLFDVNGKLVREEIFGGNQFRFYRKGLQSGIYFYNIKSNKELIFGGKLIAH